MGGPNLEIFKFGMYIMFPIGWMYYFGTNLDEKFAVPDFWPRKDQGWRIPFEKDQMNEELDKLKEIKVYKKALQRGEDPEVAMKRYRARKDANKVSEELKKGGYLDRLLTTQPLYEEPVKKEPKIPKKKKWYQE